jgi:hypothetical protein
MALCLVGLVGTAVACSGTIDENKEAPRLLPATSDTNNGSNAAGARNPAGESTATVGGTDDDSASERDGANVRGVDEGSGSSASSSRRGGVVRARPPRPKLDAGALEDAGAPEDAGAAVDAGAEVIEDAGLAGDAALL